jgi:hypothetical protein
LSNKYNKLQTVNATLQKKFIEKENYHASELQTERDNFHKKLE